MPNIFSFFGGEKGQDGQKILKVADPTLLAKQMKLKNKTKERSIKKYIDLERKLSSLESYILKVEYT